MKFPPTEERETSESWLGNITKKCCDWSTSDWTGAGNAGLIGLPQPPSLASTLTTLPLAHPAPATLASGCSLSLRPFPAFPLPAMPFRTSAEPIPLPPAGLYSNSTFSGRPLYLKLQPNPSTTFCTYHDILFNVFMVCLSLLDNLQEERYCLLFSAGFAAPKSA